MRDGLLCAVRRGRDASSARPRLRFHDFVAVALAVLLAGVSGTLAAEADTGGLASDGRLRYAKALYEEGRKRESFKILKQIAEQFEVSNSAPQAMYYQVIWGAVKFDDYHDMLLKLRSFYPQNTFTEKLAKMLGCVTITTSGEENVDAGARTTCEVIRRLYHIVVHAKDASGKRHKLKWGCDVHRTKLMLPKGRYDIEAVYTAEDLWYSRSVLKSTDTKQFSITVAPEREIKIHFAADRATGKLAYQID